MTHENLSPRQQDDFEAAQSLAHEANLAFDDRIGAARTMARNDEQYNHAKANFGAADSDFNLHNAATEALMPPQAAFETKESAEVKAFKAEQIKRLAESGWNTLPSITEGLSRHGVAQPTAEYLASAFTPEQWTKAHEAVTALSERFKDAEFADQAEWGIVLVPNPKKLDTRGAIDPAMHRDQQSYYQDKDAKDYVNPNLPAGKLVVSGDADWTMVASITGQAGIYLGSYNGVKKADSADFMVGQTDSREAMVRQVWGARVLQAGTKLPDAYGNDVWTYTTFAGEDKAGGDAPYGVVDYDGRVVFVLGHPDGGDSDVRVAPAVVIG